MVFMEEARVQVGLLAPGEHSKCILTPPQPASNYQENACKPGIHSNLIILTDIHSFTVNEDKLQN